jgi:hypothetical protein
MTYNEVVAMVQPWALNGTGVTAEEYAIGMDKSVSLLPPALFTPLTRTRNTDEGAAIESNTRYMWKVTAPASSHLLLCSSLLCDLWSHSLLSLVRHTQ